MNTHIINERERTCMGCNHVWVAPVEMSPYTFNLSGERTPHCPKCWDNAVMSGPNKAYTHMEGVCRALTNALACIGVPGEVTYSQWPNAWADPQWEIKISELNLVFYLHQEEREVQGRPTFNFKGSGKSAYIPIYKDWLWVVNVIITKTPPHRDEPPYEDSLEVSTHATAEGALIEAVLSYFRNTMYDSLPVIEPEVEESWPE